MASLVSLKNIYSLPGGRACDMRWFEGEKWKNTAELIQNIASLFSKFCPFLPRSLVECVLHCNIFKSASLLPPLNINASFFFFAQMLFSRLFLPRFFCLEVFCLLCVHWAAQSRSLLLLIVSLPVKARRSTY